MKNLISLMVMLFWGATSFSIPISITILDQSNLPTPCRVRLTHNDHVVKVAPKQSISIMYGVWDHADGYNFQPDSSFYVYGSFELDLEPGEYQLALSKGAEYIKQTHSITVAGQPLNKTFLLERWIDMSSKHWYSADDHIHIRRSPREDPLLMKWIQAEDIHVGVMLKMGDYWATYFDQYAYGNKGLYQDDDYVLSPGQEDPRTPEIGHTIGIGASQPVRYESQYYYYDKVFDKLHELGGLSGYAHQAESFHGYRGLMLDGLRKKVDFMELIQFCVSEDPLHVQHYYHLLDLGYAVTALAGSDFPWCGNDHSILDIPRNARIGNARFYTYVDGNFSYDAWKRSLRDGHTFATTGPMVQLNVNGKIPGDTLHVKKGEKIIIDASAFGHNTEVPLTKLEVVAHGNVIGAQLSTQKGQSTDLINLNITQKATDGFWIIVRAFAGKGQVAHSSPVYVSVDNGGFHNPATLSKYLDLANQYLDELQKELETVNKDPQRQAWRYRDGLEKRIKATREVIDDLRKGK